MDNSKIFFIAKVNEAICNMPASYIGYSWNLDYKVSFKVENGKVITNVDDKEYVDDMPMKGNRRDRKALGQLVGTHIAETWGGSWEDVLNWRDRLVEELYG